MDPNSSPDFPGAAALSAMNQVAANQAQSTRILIVAGAVAFLILVVAVATSR
jgi:DMSO/TMAO reductase YedYZ heme-binding membrane subunit